MAPKPVDPVRRFRVFISYRHDGTGGRAGRLYDFLSDRFGDDAVFMDLDTIRPGRDLGSVADEALALSDVVLALIGRDWPTATDGAGHPLLADPADPVRRQLTAALNRGATIIPVLLQDAPLPSAEQLPGVLAPLAGAKAVPLSDRRWRTEVQILEGELIQLGARSRPRTTPVGSVAVPGVRRPTPAASTFGVPRPVTGGADERAGRHPRLPPRRVLLAGAAVILAVAGLLTWQSNRPSAEYRELATHLSSQLQDTCTEVERSGLLYVPDTLKAKATCAGVELYYDPTATADNYLSSDTTSVPGDCSTPPTDVRPQLQTVSENGRTTRLRCEKGVSYLLGWSIDGIPIFARTFATPKEYRQTLLLMADIRSQVH